MNDNIDETVDALVHKIDDELWAHEGAVETIDIIRRAVLAGMALEREACAAIPWQVGHYPSTKELRDAIAAAIRDRGSDTP